MPLAPGLALHNYNPSDWFREGPVIPSWTNERPPQQELLGKRSSHFPLGLQMENFKPGVSGLFVTNKESPAEGWGRQRGAEGQERGDGLLRARLAYGASVVLRIASPCAFL